MAKKKTMHSVLIHDAMAGVWLRYSDPLEIVSATTAEQVLPKLQYIEGCIEADGLHAAGFISYEAGPAFDPALATQQPGDFPLLWFGLYHEPEVVADPYESEASHMSDLDWEQEIPQKEHAAVIAKIKEEIAQGNTYQVNFTHKLRTPFDEDPLALFAMMQASQPAGYGAFIDIGRFAICSASPELFFSLHGDQIISRPMKGTASRGLWPEDDHARARTLTRSPKERAENLMIADMVRNDLGKIAEFGSVNTTELFRIERYPTVWQMTSTVEAKTDASITDIFKAGFPPASITGAPKGSTMRLIAELERSPRNVYTGTIGVIQPGKKAQFNVAIRTTLIDQKHGIAEYGIGGGIVWDSQPENEWQECLTKARILSQPPQNFQLIETMLWESVNGYSLLDRHIARLAASAAYFDFSFEKDNLLRKMEKLAKLLPDTPHKVRLLLDRNGEINLESEIIKNAAENRILRVGMARRAANSRDRFLYHKTTNRKAYEKAQARHRDCDDVILTNERDEVTESCIANVVVEIDSIRYTPPVQCGLLPGTLRAELLAKGTIKERIITCDDLQNADAVYLINSVRGWMRVRLAYKEA